MPKETSDGDEDIWGIECSSRFDKVKEGSCHTKERNEADKEIFDRFFLDKKHDRKCEDDKKKSLFFFSEYRKRAYLR